MPNKIAQPQLSTVNPGTITVASMIIAALISKVNKPSVIILIGRVSKIKIGLRTKFKRPITSAVARAAKKFSTCTPGKMYELTIMATVAISQ